ncbi:biotin/lipoyl-binding protein [Plesiomonas shigelloides subsp. oncorhynchi]|nr:biotin/lipoyl-binding protein [Plesiomonas shigelloides]
MFKSKASRTVLFAIFSSLIVIFGIYKYNHQLSTRHGVVRANIIDVAPQVSGVVTAVNVKHNQQVKKGSCYFQSIIVIICLRYKLRKQIWPM